MSVELLVRIWNETDEGLRYVVTRKAGATKMLSQSFGQTEDAIAFVEKSKPGTDVWFSPAVFKPETEGRKQKHVKSIRALWLDIDVGENKDYTTFDLAATALSEFLTVTKLPNPTRVVSGNGLHVYWLLTSPLGSGIAPEQWVELSRALKNACELLGFKADPSRTCDSASLLRVPDTLNYKNPMEPKPVVLQCVEPASQYAVISNVLEPYKTLAPSNELDVSLTDDLVAIFPNVPKDANKIAEGCNQLNQFRSTGGNIPEPVWYRGIGILVHCVDGGAYAHEWSQGYSRYNLEETQRKIDQQRNFGPSTCAEFQRVNAVGCQGCPHLGNITSPIQLGVSVTPITAEPGQELVTATPLTIQEAENSYPVPEGFEVGKEGVIGTGKKGTPVVVFTFPVWVSRIVQGGRGSEAEITWITPKGTTRSASFPMGILSKNQALEEWLLNHIGGGYVEVENVYKYFKASFTAHIYQRDPDKMYDRCGWTERGFILGPMLLDGDKVWPAHLSTRVPDTMKKNIATNGSVDAWVEATALFQEPQYVIHRLVILACVGAPLLKLMDVSGALLNVAGDSGCGKTTAANFGLSTYGRPPAFEISPLSTEKSIAEHLGLANNLPVLLNETTLISNEKLSNFVYMVVNGQGRSTLTMRSEMRQPVQFATVTVMTSNRHLQNMDDHWLNEANKRRVLELTAKGDMPRELGAHINDIANNNYGVAGVLFLQYVIKNKDAVVERLKQKQKEMSTPDIPDANRFPLWLLSAASVAGEILSEMGLLKFNITEAIEAGIEALRQQANEIKPMAERVEDVLGDYILSHQGRFSQYSPDNGGLFIVEARDNCAGRYDLEKNKMVQLSIPVAKFHGFARTQNIDKPHVEEWLLKVKGTKKNVRFVRGGTPVRAYVIPIVEEGQG